MHEQEVPGLAVALFDTTDIESDVFGTLCHTTVEAVRPTTMFSLQSISKLYTATAVLRAVDRGLLDLDERLTSLVPGFTVRSAFQDRPERQITLRHLLSHTAGFTHEAPVGGNFHVGPESFDEHIASISRTWLRFPVGARYEYSNLGFDLAGHALSLRVGGAIEDAFRELLYQPFGLQRTTADVDRIESDDDRASGHAANHPTCPLKMPMVGAGGVWASVEDAARFGQAHLTCEALTPHLIEAMITPPFPAPGQELGYGLGVVSWRARSQLVRGHSGGGFGFLLDLYWLPDHHVGAAVLTNSSSHSLQQNLIRELLAQLAPRDDETTADQPQPASFRAARWSARGGTYIGRGSALELEVHDDQVGLRWPVPVEAPPFVPLVVLSDNELAFGDELGFGDLRLTFVDADGRPSHVVTSADGSVLVFNRGARLDRAVSVAVRPLLGEYVVYERGVEFSRVRLWLDDDVLYLGPWGGADALAFSHHEGPLFFSCTGELLDLESQPPTYANIRLTAVNSATKSAVSPTHH